MLTVMFPGQGSQKKGMARDLFLEFQDTIAKANALLGYSLEQLCLEDPRGELDQTVFTQPALYVVGALHWLRYGQKGGAVPDFLIGHSLGEYPALFAAGAVGFEQGLQIVIERARLMDAVQNGGMLAVLGMNAETLQSFLSAKGLASVSIANHNSPQQIILSGPRDDLQAVQQHLADEGMGRTFPLAVSGAFHSPMMEPARRQFLEFLKTQVFAEPVIPLISQATHAPMKASEIPELLSQQLTQPLRWKDCIERLVEKGANQFLEMSEGRTLMRFVSQIRKAQSSEALPLAKSMTLLDCLEQKVAQDPDREVFTFLQYDGPRRTAESMTAGELLNAARSIAAVLQSKGVKAGDRVIIFGTNARDNILSLYGAIFAGAVFTLVPPPIDEAKQKFFRSVLDATQAKFILANTMIAEKLDAKMTDGRLPRWMMRKLIKLVKGLEIVNVDHCLGRQSDWLRPNIQVDDLLYLQYSSGSTSAPKGVMITHAQLVQNSLGLADANAQRFIGLKDYSCLLWAPIFHNTGLLFTFQMLFLPLKVHLMSPLAFIEKPLRWFEALSDFKIEITSAPNTVYDTCANLIRDQDLAKLDLGSLRIIGNGAEPASIETMQRFSRKFASCGVRLEAFTVGYGLAESTCVVSAMTDSDYETHLDFSALQAGRFERVAKDHPKAKCLVPVGKPIRGVRIVVVDPDTLKQAAPGTIGEICIQGPSVAQGYWKEPELTRTTFGLKIEGSNGTFLRTGDLGILDGGYLYITGRQKELMIVNGHNVYPIDIEQAIRKSVPYLDILRVVSFSIPVDGQEKVVVCLEIPKSIIMDYARETDVMRQALLKEFGFTAWDILILEDGRLPRTNTGKVQTVQSRKLYLDQKITSIYRTLNPVTTAVPMAPKADPSQGLEAMEEQEIANFLLTELSRVSQGQAFQLGTSLSDIGLDSMTLNYLSAQISEQFQIDNDPTIFFASETLQDLVMHLARRRNPAHQASAAPKGAETVRNSVRSDEPIAIVGLAGRFPQCDSVDEFWAKLVEGSDLITDVPQDRWDWKAPHLSEALRWGGFLQDIRAFDAAFFGISPGEAKYMDPQQRLILEAAWQALENAGYRATDLKGSDTGVFIGASTHDYASLIQKYDAQPHPLATTGNAHTMLANRLSYYLNIHGPSETVDTACSSALVAVHRAVEALQRGESRMALAGAVNVILSPDISRALADAGMLSAEGRCKTFDQSASGYVRSEGVGIFILKRLSHALADRDHIHAVIRGSAVNHGGRAASLTAPHTTAQSALLMETWRKAGIDSRSISYLETHGTGTSLGDPIEVNAIRQAFRAQGEPDGCYLGAVKTQVGHLESAAGVAGLAKVVMALRHRVLPGNLHLNQVNSYLGVTDGPIRLLRGVQPWNVTGSRIAGVSSFGFGGSNAHMILEEYQGNPTSTASEGQSYLFKFSAKTMEALQAKVQNFIVYLADSNLPKGAPADVSSNLAYGREEFAYRLSLRATHLDELLQRLQAWDGRAYEEAGETGPNVYQKIPMPGYVFAKTRFWFDDRAELSPTWERLRNGAVEAPMVLDFLMTHLASKLRIAREKVQPDTDFGSLGLDSIAGLQLLSDLNQGLGLSLKPKALMDCVNCASLSQLLVQELQNISTVTKVEDTSSQKFVVLDVRHPESDTSLRELFHIRSLENLQQLRRLQPQLQIRFLLPLSTGPRLEVNISGTGELLLFLPAFGLSQAQWMPQMEVFAKEFQVMAVTLPGQGRSGALSHSSLENVAAAIEEALELLHIQRPVHVVGSSFGGLVGRAFAQAFPERVATLTLANSPDSTSILGLEDFRKRVALEVAQEMPTLARAHYEEALETIDLEFFRELFQKPMGTYRHPDRPLLLIAGRHDRIVHCQDALALSVSVPHADVSILDDGGHFPNLANPEVFNQSLRLFIAKHEK